MIASDQKLFDLFFYKMNLNHIYITGTQSEYLLRLHYIQCQQLDINKAIGMCMWIRCRRLELIYWCRCECVCVCVCVCKLRSLDHFFGARKVEFRVKKRQPFLIHLIVHLR